MAQQLKNRKSGENVAIICSVIGLQKGLENKIEINWYRGNEKNYIERLQRFVLQLFKLNSSFATKSQCKFLENLLIFFFFLSANDLRKLFVQYILTAT